MLQAIKLHLPAGVQVIPPQGGLFLWLQMPPDLSSERLLPLACRQGVNFTSGSCFFADGKGGEDCLRLKFVVHPPEEIEEGMRRLGKAMRRLSGDLSLV